MSEIIIQSVTVDEYEQAKNLSDLYSVYADEASIQGLGTPDPQMDTYRQLEAAGILHTLIALKAGKVIGFLSFLLSPLPHYGQVVATTESYFVAPEHRKGGAGLRLLREAEVKARELGAIGFFVSAPAGGRLAKVMPRSGYRLTNEVFFREL